MTEPAGQTETPSGQANPAEPHPTGRLTESVIYVTGAATGIGEGTCARLAAEGASLFLVDVAADELAGTAEAARAAGVRVEMHAVDVREQDQVDASIAACVEAFGRLDGVFNAAGVQSWAHSTEMHTATFRRDVEINLVGTFQVCRAALPHLIESRGKIVNTASTTSFAGLPYSVAYAASKGGVLALTRSLAVEFASVGVRVNCVAPGSISTRMSEPDFPDGIDYQVLMRQMSLLGFGQPADVAGVVAMLLSNDGNYITGQAITIDGGALA